MVDKPIDRQQRLAKFLYAVESAQKLQDDILKYGIEAAKLYCEDVYGDWLQKWGEGENSFLELIVDFLESNNSLAIKVRKFLSNKSSLEIAIELEKCLSSDENSSFAIKDFLVSNLIYQPSNSDFSVDNEEINLLELADNLLEKLTEVIRGKS
jgi:NurA-like 5'-3' nuclease